MTADFKDKEPPAPSARTARRALALKWHLVLLVVGALLPLVVFAAVVVYRLAESERAAHDRRLVRTAQDLSHALNRELQSTIRTLGALAESEELDGEDLSKFHAEAKRVVSTQPAWLTLILLSPDGRQLANTNVDWGTPLPWVVEPESLRRAVEQRRPVVGSITRGPFRQTSGFPVRVPVTRGGQLRYILTAVITPDALAGVVGLRGRPNEEWARVVVDTQGTIVARSHEQERFVGTRVKDSFLQRMRESGEGLFPDVARDGTTRVYVAYSREPSLGWTTAVAVPAEVTESPARGTTLAVLGLGFGLLCLSTFGAFVISRQVRRGLLAAAEAAETMSRGERPQVLTSNVKEVAQLGRALDDSAALLTRHERERDEQLARAAAARAEAESARCAQEDLLRHPRESEARLQLVADHAPVLITYCDAGRRYKFVNEPYAERFGLRPSQMAGRPIEEFLGPEAYAAIEPYVDAVLRGRRLEFEAEVPYAQLGTRHMWVAYAPELDAEGRVTGFVSAILDITERKRAEAERDQMLGREKTLRAEAEEANRLKDEFLATVSHELRTPLTAILGWAHMLAKGDLEQKTARHANFTRSFCGRRSCRSGRCSGGRLRVPSPTRSSRPPR